MLWSSSLAERQRWTFRNQAKVRKRTFKFGGIRGLRSLKNKNPNSKGKHTIAEEKLTDSKHGNFFFYFYTAKSLKKFIWVELK